MERDKIFLDSIVSFLLISIGKAEVFSDETTVKFISRLSLILMWRDEVYNMTCATRSEGSSLIWKKSRRLFSFI